MLVFMTKEKEKYFLGEENFPDRCKRVWLGATDLEEEGIWRDSETDEVLDLSSLWNAGQPTGVRIQNCAGIWELVSIKVFLKSLWNCPT